MEITHIKKKYICSVAFVLQSELVNFRCYCQKCIFKNIIFLKKINFLFYKHALKSVPVIFINQGSICFRTSCSTYLSIWRMSQSVHE